MNQIMPLLEGYLMSSLSLPKGNNVVGGENFSDILFGISDNYYKRNISKKASTNGSNKLNNNNSLYKAYKSYSNIMGSMLQMSMLSGGFGGESMNMNPLINTLAMGALLRANCNSFRNNLNYQNYRRY